MAAGEGRRMVSKIPKPLHKVCGKEMIHYPVELLQALGMGQILVVVSPSTELPLRDTLGNSVDYVVQPVPNGTGDAATWAVNALPSTIDHIVLLGSDSPLIRFDSVRQLLDKHDADRNAMTMLTAPDMMAEDLGRVMRDDGGRIVDLVEARDWNGDVWAPAEINAGVYCFNRAWLQERLAQIEPSPNGEKYLTSLVPLAARRGDRIGAVASDMPEEILRRQRPRPVGPCRDRHAVANHGGPDALRSYHPGPCIGLY